MCTRQHWLLYSSRRQYKRNRVQQFHRRRQGQTIEKERGLREKIDAGEHQRQTFARRDEENARKLGPTATNCAASKTAGEKSSRQCSLVQINQLALSFSHSLCLRFWRHSKRQEELSDSEFEEREKSGFRHSYRGGEEDNKSASLSVKWYGWSSVSEKGS